MLASKLCNDEFHPYYQTYITKSGELSLEEGFVYSFNKTVAFFEAIPEDKFTYAYAEKKWTIKELLQHIIDVERVFAYRALRFSRNDLTELPGFSENEYASYSKANRRTKESLIEEYINVRNSTLNLFKSFTKEMLLLKGKANGEYMSVRAIGFIIIGHEKHHCQVITEKYL